MRDPVAFGFYPENKNDLEKMVRNFIVKSEIKPLGAIVPHAGYIYSGSVAGAVLSQKTDKKNFIILGPNHTGNGLPIAVSYEDWSTPLGIVKTNKEFMKKLKNFIDEDAHRYEHSIEVNLPFLQILYKDFAIVPIAFQHVDYDLLEKFAEKIFDKESFYIASSDFTHFGPAYGYEPVSENVVDWVKKTDEKLIKLICKLKAEDFYNTIIENNYTVCGYIPITLLMIIMKKIGAKGKLISYKTSYDVFPNSSFVGYAGIVFE
jgi:AmmeMemoRadiSam system protein B